MDVKSTFISKCTDSVKMAVCMIVNGWNDKWTMRYVFFFFKQNTGSSSHLTNVMTRSKALCNNKSHLKEKTGVNQSLALLFGVPECCQ